ncbi:acyl-CoA dehydrogenase [Sesbania bispinosa]|nr:acyl-CoA dehydrogenase [Sesbania bispinosa]
MGNITKMADPSHVTAKLVIDPVCVENDASGPGLACELTSSRLDALHVAALREDVRLEGALSVVSLQEPLSQCCMPVECDTFKASDGASISVDLVALSAPPDLSGDDRLCDVPIAFAEDLDLACGFRSVTPSVTVKGGNIKKRRGIPRKKFVTLKVSDSDMEIHYILDKEPFYVANTFWKMGLDLGVSGYDNESVMINRLADMEKRDQLAIGRVSGL